LSLQKLQAEIESKAEDEASKILEDANQEAQKVVAEANARAASLREERTKTIERELDARERADLAIARMKRKGELLRVKSEWSKRVFEEAQKRIAEMAENGGQIYNELLSNLILEGITAMNGTKFIVEANSRDKEALSHVLGTVAKRANKIKNDTVLLQIGTLETKTLGGVVVSTEDRVQYFNNTLDARLSVASQNLEGVIRKILFGAGETDE
jgi:V/A-type H+-transporting ATPase subunit E